MAIRYYDDAIKEKLENWLPENSKLRVLGPEESSNLFKIMADDSKDSKITLPFIAISRSKDITLSNTVKQDKSSRGFILKGDVENLDPNVRTAILNAIPIEATYQFDIFAKYSYEAEEYVREFVFKLVNNPLLVVNFPYQNLNFKHTANLRILSSVSDTSDISNHLFKDQFYRWTIQLELQDGFLFNIPYKTNWLLKIDSLEVKKDPQLPNIQPSFDEEPIICIECGK